MKATTRLFTWVALLLAAGTAAAQSCVRVEAGKPLQLETAQGSRDLLSPDSAVALVVYVKSDAAFDASQATIKTGNTNAPKPNQPYIVGQALVAAMQTQASKAAAARGQLRVLFIDDKGKPANVDGGYPFYMAASEGEATSKAKACSAVSTPPPSEVARVATSSDCKKVAEESRMIGRPFESWILFNSLGTMCYAPDLLRQRDRLHFVQVLMLGELRQEAARASVTGCTVPTPGPVVLSPPTTFADLKLHSGEPVKVPYELKELVLPLECASASPVVAVTVVDAQGAEKTLSHTIALYDRYTATVHLGVLNTKLRDPEFGLRTSGGTTTIVNKEAEERGPEYTAMVIIQAFPRYFQSGLAYPGRDLLHDNEAADRVGLVLSFGLKEPAKRFGLGLSYELTRGVDLVAVHEWFKRDQLDGVKVGDTFTGTAADIPQRKTWSKAWALGLSIDLGFLTQVFGGKK